MPSTLDKRDERGFFVLMKGESGAGKSTAALSFPSPFVMDFDVKMPNIALKHFPGKEIHWETYEDIFQVQTKLDMLWADCPYETLICDSLTSLIITVLNSIGDIKNEKPMTLLRRLQATSGGKQQLELMGIDYYNGETNFIERYFINMLKALWAKPGNPKHVILTAHVITTDSAPDLKTKIVTTTRQIVTAGRKVASYVPSQYDDMWHFGYEIDVQTGNKKRVVMTDVCGTDASKIDSAKCAHKFPATIVLNDKSFYETIMKIKNNDMRV